VGNIVAIHVVFKKKNYKAKFSTSSILKNNKINKNNSEKKHKKIKKKKEEDNFEKKKQKNEKKNMWGKLKLNSQLAQY
jgi:hypothetical protein